MPNWCENSVTFMHTDKTKIDALEVELSKEKDNQLFNVLCPRPAEQDDNWYEWNCNNWGTKWDANIHDWQRQDDNTISLFFDTAWSPPIALYEYLTENDWTVSAVYHEPGMCFGGVYTSECGDEQYEYDISDKDSIDSMPQDVIDFAGLDSAYEDWISQREEEVLEELEVTEWFDGKIKPAYVGRYRIKEKDRDWEHYAEWNGKDWGEDWSGKKIKPTMWCGLVEELTSEDLRDLISELE